MKNGNGKSRGTGKATAWCALLAVLATTTPACGRNDDPTAGSDFRDLPADQVVSDLRMDIKDMGELRARLHADTAYIWEDSAKTLMFPVDLKLYDEDGAETAHLTADEGEHYARDNRMRARGHVVLVTTEGDRRILTDELHYDPHLGQIWSDKPTVMFQGNSRVEGTGFKADDQMKNIQVFKSTGENIEIEF